MLETGGGFLESVPDRLVGRIMPPSSVGRGSLHKLTQPVPRPHEVRHHPKVPGLLPPRREPVSAVTACPVQAVQDGPVDWAGKVTVREADVRPPELPAGPVGLPEPGALLHDRPLAHLADALADAEGRLPREPECDGALPDPELLLVQLAEPRRRVVRLPSPIERRKTNGKACRWPARSTAAHRRVYRGQRALSEPLDQLDVILQDNDVVALATAVELLMPLHLPSIRFLDRNQRGQAAEWQRQERPGGPPVG